MKSEETLAEHFRGLEKIMGEASLDLRIKSDTIKGKLATLSRRVRRRYLLHAVRKYALCNFSYL